MDLWRAQTDALRSRGPVGWSKKSGGHWVVVDHEYVRRAALDWQTFSSLHDTSGECLIAKGIGIPPLAFPLILSESDPPLQQERRKIEQPFFHPSEVKRWEPVIQRHVADAVEMLRGRGRGDLFSDLAMPVVAKTVFELVGIDVDRWTQFTLSSASAGADLSGEIDRVHGMLGEVVAERRRAPRSDIVSALARGEVGGRLMRDDEIVSMLSALVLGGFDTTSGLITCALIWLDEHRAAHAQLRADPALLANAMDEFLRVYPSSLGVGRTAMRDVEFGGCQIARGDRVFLSWAAANRDPKVFEAPHEVRLDRPNAAQNLSFGAGGHRCLGSGLARLMGRAAVSAVLEHLPDYRIDHAGLQRYASRGVVRGWVAVPAVMT